MIESGFIWSPNLTFVIQESTQKEGEGTNVGALLACLLAGWLTQGERDSVRLSVRIRDLSRRLNLVEIHQL